MVSRQGVEQARRTADKYIAREEGDAPSTGSGLTSKSMMNITKWMSDAAPFSHRMDARKNPQRLHGQRAFDAACRLLGFEPEIMRAHLTEDDL